ncbi:MAG: 2-iminoacetate synthase ThiH [Candidatus Margulisbacteria bacterium]|nr:2-iminoacetate synthase ThiH [Candidatus Margulisiibacteriota bacterium]
MSFLDALKTANIGRTKTAQIEDVDAVLKKDRLCFNDYLVLLSDAASQKLEDLAQRARLLTLKHFGKTIQLYVPLYLSNECDNACVYCGFNHKAVGKRLFLSVPEVEKEAEILYQKGFRHILLLSGEKRDKVTLNYLKEVISLLHKRFDSVSLEVFPLSEAEYKQLAACGADGLTIYQEVYSPTIYNNVHPYGPKSDYEFRLDTPERAGKAGFYRLNIGALLGLAPWQEEMALLGLHAAYLKKTFWQSQIAVSFPRLTDTGVGFKAPYPVSDRQLIQMICALRIFQPTLGLVLSTREKAELRNNLIPLAITQMSAESKTSPGAYSGLEAEQQFEISDKRSLQEIVKVIAQKGYEPVFKDWDRIFI